MLFDVGHLQSDCDVQAAVAIECWCVEHLGRVARAQVKDELQKVKVLSFDGVVQRRLSTFSVLKSPSITVIFQYD